jgi:hypothetical protein
MDKKKLITIIFAVAVGFVSFAQTLVGARQQESYNDLLKRIEELESK